MATRAWQSLALVSIGLVCAGAPLSSTAQKGTDEGGGRIEALLGLPPTPATELLLVEAASDLRVVARWRSSLAHASPRVRAAAARAVRVAFRVDLRKDVEAALAAEQDPLAASEQADTLIELASGAHPAALEAARRFPQPVAATVLATLLRVKPADLAGRLTDLWPAEGRDDDIAVALADLLQARPDAGRAVVDELIAKDVAGGWPVVMRAYDSFVDSDVPDAYLVAAIDSADERRREWGLERVLLQRARSDVEVPPLDGPLAAAIDAERAKTASPLGGITRDLVARTRGIAAGGRPLDAQVAAIADDSARTLILSAWRWLTDAEREVFSARWKRASPGEPASELARRHRPSPRLLSIADLPADVLEDALKGAGCPRRFGVIAGVVDYNERGRPTAIRLPPSLGAHCHQRVASLLRLGTATGPTSRAIFVPLAPSPGFGARTVARAIRIDSHRPADGEVAPVVKRQVKPSYSRDAMDELVQGHVLLSVVIGPTGRPQQIEVLRALHPSLNREALVAMSRWEFLPATRQGVPVPVRVLVEMEFALQ